MRRFLVLQLVIMLVITGRTNAQKGASPESSTSIMKEALNEANRQDKKVFIIFHASWCSWCHRMEKSMADPICKIYFEDNFIIRHLVVDENDGKKYLENPGADAFREKYGGVGQGIPYWLIFDKNGKLLADSKMRAGNTMNEPDRNIGCPATKQEVEYFISLLHSTTNLSSAQLEVIRKRFRENEL